MRPPRLHHLPNQTPNAPTSRALLPGESNNKTVTGKKERCWKEELLSKETLFLVVFEFVTEGMLLLVVFEFVTEGMLEFSSSLNLSQRGCCFSSSLDLFRSDGD